MAPEDNMNKLSELTQVAKLAAEDLDEGGVCRSGVHGAARAAYMVDELDYPLSGVLAALGAIGDGPVGCGPEVEEQIAVDDFRLIYSYDEWMLFGDGSILSPDGTEYHAANDIDRAAADQVASDRDDALDAQFDARIGDLREIERGEI